MEFTEAYQYIEQLDITEDDWDINTNIEYERFTQWSFFSNSFSHIFLGAHNVASFFTRFLAKKEYQYLEQITLFFMWIYVSKAMKHMPLLTKHILQREWIIIFKREWEKLNRIQKGSASSFWVNYHKNFRCKFIETT